MVAHTPEASLRAPMHTPSRRQIRDKERADRRNPLVWLREIAVTLSIAVVVSTLLRLFVVQVFWIPSSSMHPTLQVNDRISVSRVAAWTGSVERGDIVVFVDKLGWLSQADSSGFWRALGEFTGLLPADGSQILVKRVIGVAGDRVACEGDGAPVTVNGVPVSETYIDGGIAPSERAFDVTVPEGHVWVMGDNRLNSADSRFHMPEKVSDTESPFVPVDAIVGRANAVIWPLDHWRTFDGREVFDQVPDGGVK